MIKANAFVLRERERDPAHLTYFPCSLLLILLIFHAYGGTQMNKLWDRGLALWLRRPLPLGFKPWREPFTSYVLATGPTEQKKNEQIINKKKKTQDTNKK